ncbi:MAG: hypothetical protein M1828_002740 [Chrysothrix sp. TS-e1954]|nr:MAG: hypothetical protein M1828_002740 [Chrysothrix sp. TS-e1954]
MSRSASTGRPTPYPYSDPSGSIQRYSSHHGTSSAFSASANPNEDWTKVSDLAERRRIQNRIAQRNYRKKLKKRLEDLEKRAGSSASPEPEPEPESESRSKESSPQATTSRVPAQRSNTRACASAPPDGNNASPDPSVEQPNAYFLQDDRLQFSHPTQRSPSPPPPVPYPSQSGSFDPMSFYQQPSHSPVYQSYDPGYEVPWFDRSSAYGDSLSSVPPSSTRFPDLRRAIPVKQEFFGDDMDAFTPLGINNFTSINSTDLAAQQQQSRWQFDTQQNNPHVMPPTQRPPNHQQQR